MLGIVLRLGVVAAILGAGWLGGSLFPAPRFITDLVIARGEGLAERIDGLDLDALKQRLAGRDYDDLRRAAAHAASDAGEAIIVERTGAERDYDAIAAGAGEGSPRQAVGAFARGLVLCPGMSVANAPAADAEGRLTSYTPVVDVQGVSLAVNPTRDACLSSGFGNRNGRRHKGVDYHNDSGGPILAAADGVVLEKKYRDDYGNMLVIDHGQGVYTRYAHLSSFADGLSVGARVGAGQQLGLMGNTAGYAIPVHLHFELLLGDYATQAGSFGLTPRDPFSFAAAP